MKIRLLLCLFLFIAGWLLDPILAIMVSTGGALVGIARVLDERITK